MKRIVGFARVSSAEQAATGFSLQAQADKIRAFAASIGATVVEMFTVAESANVSQARKVFQRMLAFARDKKSATDAVVFDRVDRATRSQADLAELETLRKVHGVISISLDLNVDSSTPQGEFSMTINAAVAAMSNRLLAERVKENMEARARSGLFVGHAPFGYENYRDERGRSLVRIHERNGPIVRRIFHLIAYDGLSVAEVARRLAKEGIKYTDRSPRFPLSKLNTIVHDRAYLGEVRYHEEWIAGKGRFESLVDLKTFVRAQERISRRKYLRHEFTYSHSLINCGHCGRAITADCKSKVLADGQSAKYVYYRCAGIGAEGHPKVRLRENALDAQALAVFDSLRLSSDEQRQWFVDQLTARTRANQEAAALHRAALRKDLGRVAAEKDRLVRLHLAGEVARDSYQRLHEELVERESRLLVQVEEGAAVQSAEAELVVKAFGLSQDLAARWDAGGVSEKRMLLDTVSSEWLLEGETLVPKLRMAFQVLRLVPAGGNEEDGTPGGIRTHDLQLRRLPLYPAELRAPNAVRHPTSRRPVRSPRGPQNPRKNLDPDLSPGASTEGTISCSLETFCTPPGFFR